VVTENAQQFRLHLSPHLWLNGKNPVGRHLLEIVSPSVQVGFGDIILMTDVIHDD
jgi:hypothetical protein